MWKDDDIRIMNILDSAEMNEKKQFPVFCPICGKREGHLYFHKYNDNENAGGMWTWCSACKHSAHTRFKLPERWKNLEKINFQELSSHPDYLEKNKIIIDEWINKLIQHNLIQSSTGNQTGEYTALGNVESFQRCGNSESDVGNDCKNQ